MQQMTLATTELGQTGLKIASVDRALARIVRFPLRNQGMNR